MQEREAALIGLPRDLSHCAEKMKARGITAEAAARRTRIAREARKARGLDTGKSCQSFASITRPGDLESPGSCCELAPGSL
jgi:hypothetical protein